MITRSVSSFFRFPVILLVSVLLLDRLANIPAQAEEHPAAIDGKWKLVTTYQSGDRRKGKLTLKTEDGKVTGSYNDENGGKFELKKVEVHGDEITFEYNRQFGKQKREIKFSGKIDGDKIKGQSEFETDNGTRKSAWEADRILPPYGSTGTWKWNFTRDDGVRSEFTLKLTETTNELSGVSISPNKNQLPISDAHAQGDQVSFKVVRERDDRKFTMFFKGKRTGNTLMGTVDQDWTGEIRSYDWKAERQED